MENIELEDIKNHILKIASRCFTTHGFNGTTDKYIIAEAAIDHEVFYTHFTGKDEILREICFSKADKFDLGIAEVNDLYFSAADKLRMAISQHVKIITDDVYSAHVFLYEWKQLKNIYNEEFKKRRNKYTDAFKQIIIDGENENIFNESDKQFAVLTILSSVNWICEWYTPQGKLKPQEIADKITDFVLRGLLK
ncbi:MAG: TetR/AcrR family transcriptional regulator [Bacteroidetes bacterium]|nr:TetR/AcrR family transcriptional regulator [Bacteroidota bacterium]